MTTYRTSAILPTATQRPARVRRLVVRGVASGGPPAAEPVLERAPWTVAERVEVAP